MKLFGAIYWAIILIIIGTIIILNQIFNWHIGVFAIVFGVILISLGIYIITRPANSGIKGIFANGNITSTKSDNSYIFSNVTLDIDNFDTDNIEINCVFSSVKLHTKEKSVKIKADGVFSTTQFPDNTVLSFGNRVYERDGKNTVHIKTSCVFGTLIID